MTGVPKLTPSVYRYYAAMMAAGFASGIVWTMTLLQAKWISHEHAIMTLWAVFGFLLSYQIMSLGRYMKLMKAAQAEIDQMYKNLRERGLLPNGDEDKPVYRM